MTRRATFGDFAITVTRHLRRLQRVQPSAADRATVAELVADLSRAVHALAGYADDVVRVLNAERVAGERQLGVWVSAATQTRQALASAEAALSMPLRPDDGVSAARPRRETGDLPAATRSMTLGRDLLHTHDASGSSRLAPAGSEWTPVVSSAPVACAVLHQVGGWTRQISDHAYRISSTGSCPAAERRALSTVGKTLAQACWAIGAAKERRPVGQSQLRLLHAIPVNAVPEPCLPASGASVAELNAGVISTAERLRIAARHASAKVPWSRQLTRETLRQTAGCCAICASNMQIVLSTLSEHGTLGVHDTTSLAEAAAAADRARAAWLAATDSWNSITTDARADMGPAGAEAAALALWTGRLAYADPDWAPAFGPRHSPRAVGELAVGIGKLRSAVDAAHHVAHTLTQVAESDRDQVRIASMAGRLIVPTRSLPDECDVPYRFAPAPASHTATLLTSYDRALQASDEATAAMAEVAAELQADSRVLTTARAAARGDLSAWAGQPVREPSADLGRSQERGSVVATRQPQLAPPGPVERALLELDVTSKPDLEQAAAIDKAADQLILRAAARPKPAQHRDLSRSAGRAELVQCGVAAAGARSPIVLRPRPSARQAEIEAGA